MVEETKRREKIRQEKLKDLFFLLYVNRKKERQLLCNAQEEYSLENFSKQRTLF